MTSRLTCWHPNWLADILNDWLISWMTDLTSWLTDWHPGWLTDILIEWLTFWLTDWHPDWLTDILDDESTDRAFSSCVENGIQFLYLPANVPWPLVSCNWFDILPMHILYPWSSSSSTFSSSSSFQDSKTSTKDTSDLYIAFILMRISLPLFIYHDAMTVNSQAIIRWSIHSCPPLPLLLFFLTFPN